MIKDKINILLVPVSVAGGLFSTMLEEYLILIILVAAAISLDVISGLIKAAATGEPITSQKGTKGFFKKIVLLFSMTFAFFLDVAMPLLFEVCSISLPFEKSLLFGSVVCVYIVLNESISITENILKTNNKAVPKWLKKLLQGAKNEIDKKEVNGNEIK